MGHPVEPLSISDEDRHELERRKRSSSIAKRDSFRARVILLRAAGLKESEVAQELGTTIQTVSKWNSRFKQTGLAGLIDAKGRGRRPSLPAETVSKIVTQVTQPPPHRTRWSTRSMAQAVGVSESTVRRVWHRNDLKPHRIRTFKLSKDKNFEAKFWDVIGLYLNPPEKALVLCCDEKTQCQALERSQPGLPLGIGHIRTQTHDYKRHGTITLFAALNYLEGKLITRTEARHTNEEWLRFLRQIDRETPREMELHLIADNYSTHKHANVREWLSKHPRFHLHYTPTSSSWLNMVERFFADLTTEVVREGSFKSVRQLVDAIEGYLAERNLQPKPYHWKASGQEILLKIKSAREALEAAIIDSA